MIHTRPYRATAALTILAAAGLALAACGGGAGSTESADAGTTTGSSAPATTESQSSSATPTSVDPLPGDQALVRTLYYDDSQATNGDLRSEAEFIAAHNHPDFHYTSDECHAFFRQLGMTDSYVGSQVPDMAAMAPDSGWALPASAGRYAGMVPSGRIYILPVHISETDTQTGLQSERTEQRHVAIVNDTAYYFQACEQ